MAVSSQRSVIVAMSGDVILNEEFAAAENTAGPGSVSIHTLSSGNNTITVPATSGITIKGATIVPPVGNTQTLTLKGVNGDTGISLHATDPTSIAFGTAPANFVLSAGGTIAGLRIIWS